MLFLLPLPGARRSNIFHPSFNLAALSHQLTGQCCSSVLRGICGALSGCLLMSLIRLLSLSFPIKNSRHTFTHSCAVFPIQFEALEVGNSRKYVNVDGSCGVGLRIHGAEKALVFVVMDVRLAVLFVGAAAPFIVHDHVLRAAVAGERLGILLR